MLNATEKMPIRFSYVAKEDQQMLKQKPQTKQNLQIRLRSFIDKLPLIKQARKKRKLKAIDELVGLWADKDTSFFDKR